MKEEEIRGIKSYYGKKLRCIRNNIHFQEKEEYERLLLKANYSDEDWKQIINSIKAEKENSLDSGDYNPNSFTGLNVEPLHFIYELVQNADDCDATEVAIEINKEAISFEHNGELLFRLKDFLNICSLGESDKEESKIGKFGVGFKTVFSFCKEPIVSCSNGCSFRLKEIVVPEYFETNVNNTKKTSFLLNIFQHKKNEILDEQLKNFKIDWNIILFLNKAKKISIKNSLSQEDFTIEIKGEKSLALKEATEVSISVNKETSHWLIREYKVNELKEKYNIKGVPKITFAFNKEEGRIVPYQGFNRFYLYMPLESQPNPFKFLIHADFKCILNRGALPDNDYNRDLFVFISEKLCNLTEDLAKCKDYQYCFLNALPLPKQEGDNPFLANFPEDVKKHIATKIKFKDNFGGVIQDSPFVIIEKSLKDILSGDFDLVKRFSKSLVSLEFDECSKDYMLKWGIANEFGVNELVNELMLIDLSHKSDDWLTKLYLCFYDHLKMLKGKLKKFSSDSEDYKTLEKDINDYLKRVSNLKIYKNQYGKLDSLFYQNSNVVKYFYMPQDKQTEDFQLFKDKITFLDETFIKNTALSPFFKELIINEFETASIIESFVLVRFEELSKKELVSNEEEIFRLTQYVFEKVSGDPEIDIKKVRDSIPIKTKMEAFVKPTKVYLSKEYTQEDDPSFFLEELLTKLESAQFLDPIYLEILSGTSSDKEKIRTFFTKIGVETKPRIKTVTKTFSEWRDWYQSDTKERYGQKIEEEMAQVRLRRSFSDKPSFRGNSIEYPVCEDLFSFLELWSDNSAKAKAYTKMLVLLNKNWDEYSSEHQITIEGRYSTAHSDRYPHSINIKENGIITELKFRQKQWIPSDQGLKKAKEVFYNNDGLRLIPNQPYLPSNVKLTNNDFIETFFRQEEISDVIAAVETIKKSNVEFKEKLTMLSGIFKFLSSRLSENIKKELINKDIILVKNAAEGEIWCSVKDIFWNYSEANIPILGPKGYVSEFYHHELFTFLNQLGMRDKPEGHDYLKRLIELEEYSKEGLTCDEFKKIRHIIYERIEELLEKKTIHGEDITEFKQKGVVYCTDNKFHKLGDNKIFYNDNKKLCEKFLKNVKEFSSVLFVYGDSKDFSNLFSHLGLLSFDEHIARNRISPYKAQNLVEESFFDLAKTKKYIKSVLEHRKIKESDKKRIKDLDKLRIVYADEIKVRYAFVDRPKINFLDEDDYDYESVDGGGCYILVGKRITDSRRRLAIARGLCKHFGLTSDEVLYKFHDIIEYFNDPERLEERLEAYGIELVSEDEEEPPEKKETPGGRELGEESSGKEEPEGGETGEEPPDKETTRGESTTTTKQRDTKVETYVKQVYHYACAVCNLQIFDFSGNPEVVWAHIKPVKTPHNGPDHIKNSIALCHFHHWAFDKGLFSISDDFRIIVSKELPNKSDYNNNIKKFENQKIQLPARLQDYPAVKFLQYHRKIHGFEK